jgi:hypothetical protein
VLYPGTRGCTCSACTWSSAYGHSGGASRGSPCSPGSRRRVVLITRRATAPATPCWATSTASCCRARPGARAGWRATEPLAGDRRRRPAGARLTNSAAGEQFSNCARGCSPLRRYIVPGQPWRGFLPGFQRLTYAPGTPGD